MALKRVGITTVEAMKKLSGTLAER
jgi:hypothetical protein